MTTDVHALAETTLGRAERYSVRPEIERAPEILDAGETVALIAVGTFHGSGNSLILATDRRLIVVNQSRGLFGKKLRVDDVAYDRIQRVGSETGTVSGTLALATAGGDLAIERILPPGRAAELAAYVRARLAP